ncbi:MAG: MATE family efflux transporter [Neomegalonema sp.]|nr:MATE family efflux transporter [Neomegalonema sp.]
MTKKSPDSAAITYRRVFLIALPVVLSNATIPLQGAIDTALIGNLGQTETLAAVGLGAELFSLVLAGFNFLQIGSSGLSSQALGAGKYERVVHILYRGLTLALMIGALLMLARFPIVAAGLALFEASPITESIAGQYALIRLFAAPAELMNYALLGWFAGQEMTRTLLKHQLVTTLGNIALSIVFVRVFGWGVPGVAIATVIAAYLGLAFGLWLAWRRRIVLVPAQWRPQIDRVFNKDQMLKLFALNGDIFVRTILLVAAFAWMTRLGSMQGDTILAANVVLWQFFFVSAYALDGFAIAAETLVGQAIGARSPEALARSVRATTVCAGLLSLAISLICAAFNGAMIDFFTNVDEVRRVARDYAYWAAFTPFVGFAAFQLDGIFVGATGSAQMRNGMIITSAIYFPLSSQAAVFFGNHGLWAAIWVWLLLRAATLLCFYPAVRARALGPRTHSAEI